MNSLMEFVKRREKEVNFFYSQLDKWIELEPELSFAERASVLCDVINCFDGVDICHLDSMYQFVTCESWKDTVPVKSKEYIEYVDSFDTFIKKLEHCKTVAETINVLENHKNKCVALLRLLDYHSIRRIIDECIADGVSEQHFTLI